MWNPKAEDGWETTPHNYHADNVQRMERMLGIITDIPQYRNVHRALNYKVTCEEPFSWAPTLFPIFLRQGRTDKVWTSRTS